MAVVQKTACILVCVVLLLMGCSTTQTQSLHEDALSYLDVSSYPSNVYVGISGPYSTKELMVTNAILSAAKSIHLNKALSLDSRLVTSYRSDVGLTSFAVEDAAFYDDSEIAQTTADLEVLSIHFDKDAGAVVVVQNPGEIEEKRPYQSVYDAFGRPTWLHSYPDVNGYRFGIGSAKRYYYLNDSLEAADYAAAQNILDLKTDHAFSIEKVVTEDDLMKRSLYQAQRGLLQGFSIIARYYDEQTQTYWSLAACKE